MRYPTLLALMISVACAGSFCPAWGELPLTQQSLADRSLQRAELFFSQNQFDSALILYEIAANQFKAQTQWEGYVKSMAGKGFSLIRLRNFEPARAVLDTALSVGTKSLGENPEVATVYYVYGILHDFTNKPEEALAMHRESLRIRKELLGAKHFKVAESYNGIGEVYRYTLRNYVEAEKNFRWSLYIIEQLPDIERKYLFRGYYNLATTNRLKNDFEKALGYGFKAIETLESIKPADTLSFIRTYGIIANIYNNQNIIEKAIAYYRKALELRVARNEQSAEMANDYKNLAQAYIVKDNFTKALHCVDSALMIIRKSPSYDSGEMANIYLIKGKALRESHRYQEAQQNYKQSLAIQQHYSRSNPLDISNIYLHISQALEKAGEFDSALSYVQKSIVMATRDAGTPASASNPPFEILKQRPQLYMELAHKGSVLIKLAEKTDDINTFRQALDCLTTSDKLMDLYWGSQDRENSRLHFIGSNYYIYEQALNIIYQLYHLTKDEGYKELAFQLMDKSKARLLREELQKIREHARRNIPDSLLSQERTIRSSITALQNQLASLKPDVLSDSLARKLNSEMLTREKELEQWRTKIQVQFPNYTSESRLTPVMGLGELQEKLADETLFVEYFFGTDVVYAFASLKGRHHLIRIESSGLHDNIYRFCRLLSEGLRSEDLKADFKEYTVLASDLYTKLLSPIFHAFDLPIDKGHRQLVIIPDGALALLPFQALITSRLEEGHPVDYKALDYLVRHCAISYSYDAASLFALNHRESWGKDLLAFGWSDSKKQLNASSLPGTYEELQSIGNIISGRFMMGEEASKNSFVTLAPDYSILHLAIHGQADDQDIYNNYLQFRDEKLFAHELYGFHLNANLTVLSACETGYGKVFDAEGVYSLARGFFHAGSKSLLMTLWRIGDQSTASLMREFYRNIDRGEYLTNAIHHSQLTYLEKADQYSAHPSYWAGVVLWGTHKEVAVGNVLRPIYIAIPALLVVLIALSLFMVFRRMKRRRASLERATN